MAEQQMMVPGGETEPAGAANPELESLATSVELTLASVLQGIAVAILVPKIVELITGGDLAKRPPAIIAPIFPAAAIRRCR